MDTPRFCDYVSIDEWNLVYFVGLNHMMNTNKKYKNLDEHISHALTLLNEREFEFELIDVNDVGAWRPNSTNKYLKNTHNPIQEIKDKQFDWKSRAKALMHKFGLDFKYLDMAWLNEMLSREST